MLRVLIKCSEQTPAYNYVRLLFEILRLLNKKTDKLKQQSRKIPLQRFYFVSHNYLLKKLKCVSVWMSAAHDSCAFNEQRTKPYIIYIMKKCFGCCAALHINITSAITNCFNRLILIYCWRLWITLQKQSTKPVWSLERNQRKHLMGPASRRTSSIQYHRVR